MFPTIPPTLIWREVVIWKFVTLLCSIVVAVASPSIPPTRLVPEINIKSFTWTFRIAVLVALLARVPLLFTPDNFGLSKIKFSIVADSSVSNNGLDKL